MRDIEAGKALIGTEVICILDRSAVCPRAEPLIGADIQRLRPCVGEEVGKPVACFFVKRNLQRVIPGLSGANVIMSWYLIRIRETSLGRNLCGSARCVVTAYSWNQTRSRGSGLVAGDADVQPMIRGTDIVNRQRRARRQRLLHSKIPLIGIWILDVWVDKPIVLFKRGWQGRGVGTLQRIFRENRRRSRILIEGHDELPRRRPSSLLILRHLENGSPIVEKPAEGGSYHRPIGQAVGDAHTRLNVVVRVVP